MAVITPYLLILLGYFSRTDFCKKGFGSHSPQLSVPHVFGVRNLDLKFLNLAGG